MVTVFPKLCLFLAVILWKCYFLIAARVYIDDYINVCENVADHIFIQDIEDCTKYFVCVDGKTTSQQCRSGLYFDAKRQACIASRQGCLQCPSSQMINVLLIKTCDKYISCYYGHALLMKCENQQQFNAKTGKCDLAQNVDCVENRCSIHAVDNKFIYVPSIASCKNYHICIAGQAKSLTCAQGLYFSTKCNCCNRAENVECLIEAPKENFKEKRLLNNFPTQSHTPTLIEETNKVICPPKGSFLYQYIEDPQYYYRCVDSRATLYACGMGYQFDDKLKHCINIMKEEEQLVTEIFENPKLLVQCPEFGAAIMPHTENSKYILCVNGNATVFDCPADHYYYAEDNVCHSTLEKQRKKELSRYGTVLDEFAGIVCPKFATFTFPHVEKNKFYLCLDGKASVFTCAEEQIFEISLQGCRDEDIMEKEFNVTVALKLNNEFVDTKIGRPVAAQHLTSLCPPRGNTTLPHSLKNQYYLCVKGKVAVFFCPQGLLYEAKLKSCTESASPSLVVNEVYQPTFGSQTANIMCPKFGTFKFSHIDRTKYYLCTDSKIYTLACGPNEIFDVEINICRENLLLELEGHNNSTTKEEHKNTTIVQPTKNSSSVVSEIASNIICPKFGTFIYPHAQKDRYYVCIDGNAIGFTCIEGHIYDTKTNACKQVSLEPSENIEDQMPVVLDELINILCPASGAITFAHEKKNKFYLCVNGMASVLACAKGSFFDSETGACRRIFFTEKSMNETGTEETEKIEPETELKTTNEATTVESETKLETEPKSSVKCPRSGNFIYSNLVKNQYYFCLEGQDIALTCPKGQLFDPKEKSCRFPSKNQNDEDQASKVPDMENFKERNSQNSY